MLRKTGRNKLEGATLIVSFLLSPLFHRDRRSKSRSGTALRPILLSATNHYEDCLSPFLRYKKYSKEAKKYHQQLKVPKTMYRNECLCLLEDVVEHEVATNMLNLPTHKAWLDGELDGQVVRQLGDSKDACIAVIELIE